MKWRSFIENTYLINLTKRTDRLLASAEQLEDYEIPYERIEAVENENGAKGLRDTMINIFDDALEKEYENILVLEDDFDIVVGKGIFDDVMNKVSEQLPSNYLICFLGGQPTGGYSSFYSPNLLPAYKYFSTHSVIYSRQGIKEIMARGLGFPIDNWYVDELETIGNCYAVDPLLCSQRPGQSDIYRNFIDWSPFIQIKHQQEINKIRNR